jgi:phosphoserine phosphatase
VADNLDSMPATAERRDSRNERELLESRRARNRLVADRASRRVAEIRREIPRSERAVERAVRRLRDAGVIR